MCSRYDKLMQSALSLRPVDEFDGCIGEQMTGLGRQDAAAEGRLVADAPVGQLDDKGMSGWARVLMARPIWTNSPPTTTPAI